MRRCSLFFLLLSGCLVQDPAWVPPEQTGGGTLPSAESDTTGGSSGTTTDDTAGNATTDTPPPDTLPADCTPLPSVPSDALVVGPADNASLHTIFAEAAPGSTIALKPGTYDRSGQPALVIAADGVTIRSTSGSPEDVVLDGGLVGVSTLLTIRSNDALLAEFTLQGSSGSLVDIGVDDQPLEGDALYRMVLRDGGGPKLHVGSGSTRWTDDGVVACSTFEQSDGFRDSLDDCGQVAAIKISAGARWIIRDNLFAGHWCSTAANATVMVDLGSSDTRIERNILQNNFRGILLGGDDVENGRPEPPGDGCGEPQGSTWAHIRGVVVNNVIWTDDPRMAGAVASYATDLDSMIAFWHVCGGVAVHNTSYPGLTTFTGIEWRYPDTTVTVANNLIATTLVPRTGGIALGTEHNTTGVTAAEFVDAAAGDFRLAAGVAARDAGIVVPAVPVPEDFDRSPRTGQPDMGAFESQP